MQTGRNQPCPCSSGRKYKHCCLNKEQLQQSAQAAQAPPILSAPTKPMGNIIPASFAPDDDKDIDIMGSSFSKNDLFNVMHGLQGLVLGRLPHIKAYKKLRKLHDEIVSSMVDHFDAGKFTLTIEPDYSAPEKQDMPEANSIINTTFDTDTDEGMQYLYDIHIYKSAPNTNCITEEFIRTKRYRKPIKIAMLQSMNDSVRGLFEVTGADSGEGYVTLREVFTNQEYKIFDIAMSSPANNFDDFYVYRRIITVQEISFGVSGTLIFAKTDHFVQDLIKRHKENYRPQREMVRFIELFNHYTNSPQPVAIQMRDVRL